MKKKSKSTELNDHNIMIITYEMIPYSTTFGGCQRMFFLAKYLSNNNFKVHVISCKKNYEGYLGKEINFDCTYIKVKNVFFEKFLRNRVRKGKSFYKINNKIKKKFSKFVKKLVRLVFNEPNPLMGLLGYLWVKSAKNEIINLIKKREISKVIISFPPFSLGSIVKIIRRRFPNILIVLDYRDPWNMWNEKRTYHWIREKKILNIANKIVFASENLRLEMGKRFSIDSCKTEAISNGYSKKSWSKVICSNNYNNCIDRSKLIFSHIGSISFRKNSYRSAKKLIEAYEKFPYKNETILRFVGISDKTVINKLDNKHFEIIKQVTHEASLEYMLCSDILIILHSSNDESGKYICTAKLFDYIRSNKVIYGIGRKDTFFNDLIRKENFGITSTYEVKDIFNTLLKIYKFWKLGNLNYLRKGNKKNIEKYSREYQNKKYLELLR